MIKRLYRSYFSLLLLSLFALGCGSSDDFVFTDGQQVGGVPARLSFQNQPSRTAGQSFDPAPTVLILDADGNLVTTANNTVTLTLGNAGTAVLSGTTTVDAVNGIATFPGLSVDIVGPNYTLIASSPGLDGTTSELFVITPDVANGVLINAQPQNTDAGGTLPAVVVDLRDAFGNVDTNNNATVTVTLTPLNGGAGVLGGTTTVNAVNGVATFNDLTVDSLGQYTLTFSSGTLTDGTTDPFSVTESVLFGTFPGQEPGQPAYLARINPTDGTFQTVGRIGGNFFPLACTADGRLLAAGNDAMTTDAELREINQATGATTLIGTISNNDDPNGCEDVRDLTFDAVTSTLFAIIDDCNGGANPGLFTIDLATGAGTKLSDGLFAMGTTGQGLAADSTGALFHTPADNFVSINPADGVMTSLFTGTLGLADITGLAFQTGTDVLFAADRVGSRLRTITTATGTLDQDFATAPGIDGLTFCQSSTPFVDQNPVIDATIALDVADISGTGTPFGLPDDGNTGLMPIGFDFTYYGQTFTEFDISSNGFITFGSVVAAGFTNEALPNMNNPNMICLYWDDLDPLDDGAQLFTEVQGVAPNRVLVVQYEEFDFFPGDGAPGGSAVGRMQLKLFEGSNIIEFHYETLAGADGSSATIGIQDGSGTRASQFSFNTPAAISNGTAIRFTPPAP